MVTVHCFSDQIRGGVEWKKRIRALFTLIPKPAVSMPSSN